MVAYIRLPDIFNRKLRRILVMASRLCAAQKGPMISRGSVLKEVVLFLKKK